MQNVTFREPVIEDAKEIVDFYNYVGGETSFLSFEKDECTNSRDGCGYYENGYDRGKSYIEGKRDEIKTRVAGT